MHHAPFVHLHLHTHYSLLDGAIRLDALFAKAQQYKIPALAITDHGNMFGAIEFYQQASRHGIKPIIGCEIYVAPGSRYVKDSRSGEGPSITSSCWQKIRRAIRTLFTWSARAILKAFTTARA